MRVAACMSAMGRTPFFARQSAEATSNYEALADGVPLHLRNSLWNFCVRRICPSKADMWGNRTPELYLVLAIERQLRIQLDSGNTLQSLATQMFGNDDMFLSLTEFLVNEEENPTLRARIADELTTVFKEAGSAFEFGGRLPDGTVCLTRRVDETTKAAFDKVVASSEQAAGHLQAAWIAVYGRNPNPTHGFSEAIKAVEAIAQPLVEPNNAKATLGSIIGQLNQKPPQFEFVLRAGIGHTDAELLERATHMCETLWWSQTDRHGMENPRPVTADQAEAGVHLAVTLVHWFSRGFIARKV